MVACCSFLSQNSHGRINYIMDSIYGPSGLKSKHPYGSYILDRKQISNRANKRNMKVIIIEIRSRLITRSCGKGHVKSVNSYEDACYRAHFIYTSNVCNHLPPICVYRIYIKVYILYPSGLRHALSSLARKPGSWVRISLRPWMFGVRFSRFVYR
jgi:hypothetical protein